MAPGSQRKLSMGIWRHTLFTAGGLISRPPPKGGGIGFPTPCPSLQAGVLQDPEVPQSANRVHCALALLALRSLTRLLGEGSAPGLAQVAAAVPAGADLSPGVAPGHAQLSPGRQRPSP